MFSGFRSTFSKILIYMIRFYFHPLSRAYIRKYEYACTYLLLMCYSNKPGTKSVMKNKVIFKNNI